MGKARIISHIAAGEYNIELYFDETRIDKRQLELTEEFNDIFPVKIAAALTAWENAKTAMQSEQDDLVSLIDDLNFATQAKHNCPITPGCIQEEADQELILKQQIVIAKQNMIFIKSSDIRTTKRNYDELRARKLAIQKEQSLLAASPGALITTAWCTDLADAPIGESTTTPGGTWYKHATQYAVNDEVGTIDIVGTGEHIIRPKDNAGLYDFDRDGNISLALNSEPLELYANQMIAGGAVSFKPRYRKGVISSIDNASNKCSVYLTEVAIFTSGLKTVVSPGITLSNVPVDYMTCDSHSFDLFDEVVVQFLGNYANAVLIGFVSNPQTCRAGVYMRLNMSERETTDYREVRIVYETFDWPPPDEYVNFAVMDNSITPSLPAQTMADQIGPHSVVYSTGQIDFTVVSADSHGQSVDGGVIYAEDIGRRETGPISPPCNHKTSFNVGGSLKDAASTTVLTSTEFWNHTVHTTLDIGYDIQNIDNDCVDNIGVRFKNATEYEDRGSSEFVRWFNPDDTGDYMTVKHVFNAKKAIHQHPNGVLVSAPEVFWDIIGVTTTKTLFGGPTFPDGSTQIVNSTDGIDAGNTAFLWPQNTMEKSNLELLFKFVDVVFANADGGVGEPDYFEDIPVAGTGILTNYELDFEET